MKCLSGTVGATTLTVEQMSNHTHTTTNKKGILTNGTENRLDFGSAFSFDENKNLAASGGSKNHTHALSGGKIASISSLPPYYVLALIMRVA